jgi:hypothetical protein
MRINAAPPCSLIGELGCQKYFNISGFNDARASISYNPPRPAEENDFKSLENCEKARSAPDDNRSFAESLLVAIASSPDRVGDARKPSQRKQIESLGLTYTTRNLTNCRQLFKINPRPCGVHPAHEKSRSIARSQ